MNILLGVNLNIICKKSKVEGETNKELEFELRIGL